MKDQCRGSKLIAELLLLQLLLLRLRRPRLSLTPKVAHPIKEYRPHPPVPASLKVKLVQVKEMLETSSSLLDKILLKLLVESYQVMEQVKDLLALSPFQFPHQHCHSSLPNYLNLSLPISSLKREMLLL